MPDALSDARAYVTEIEALCRRAHTHLATDDPYAAQRAQELVWDALCRFDALHEAITDAEAEAVAPTRVLSAAECFLVEDR